MKTLLLGMLVALSGCALSLKPYDGPSEQYSAAFAQLDANDQNVVKAIKLLDERLKKLEPAAKPKEPKKK